MEATELDILLDELETRVERLRALYEQYFLGIEKIPPHVAQKDVDRRLYTLRREQIRNTARRFKLQTIIQRYNTFQQYWMRIMREIENGTYRRHVLRAERTVGITDHLTAAERKRLALPERDSHTNNSREPPPEPDEESDDSSLVATNPAPPSRQANPSERAARPSIAPVDSPSAVRAQIERDLGLLLDDDLDELDTKGLGELGSELDDPLMSSMPPPFRRRASAKPVARRSSRPGLERRRAQTPRSTTPASVEPPPATQDAPPATQDAPSSTADSAASSTTSLAKRHSLRPSRPLPGTGVAAQGGLRLPAFSAVAGRGLPPLPKSGLPRGAPKPTNTPNAPLGNSKTGAAPSTSTGTSTSTSTGTSTSTSTGTSTEAPSRPTSGQNPQSTEKQVPPESVADASTARSVVAAAAPPKARAEFSANEAPSQASTGRDPGFERRKVEHLAEKLRSARLQTHENSPVSVDALAKKLEATAAQLREKHRGRQIDFDVVIKDGKAIVKPIVR